MISLHLPALAIRFTVICISPTWRPLRQHQQHRQQQQQQQQRDSSESDLATRSKSGPSERLTTKAKATTTNRRNRRNSSLILKLIPALFLICQDTFGRQSGLTLAQSVHSAGSRVTRPPADIVCLPGERQEAFVSSD